MISNKQIILVVENEFIICQNVCEVLEDEGYTAFSATSIEEAFKIMNVTDDIDLLVTDIDLGSSFNGFDLAKSAIKMFVDIPVIFVTGSSKTDSKLKGMTVLIKPYDNAMLLKSVAEALNIT